MSGIKSRNESFNEQFNGSNKQLINSLGSQTVNTANSDPHASDSSALRMARGSLKED